MIPQLAIAYQHLNETLFDDQLPDPDFFVDPNRTGVMGFSPPNIICLCRDFPQATPQMILDETLHQMIHVEHYQRGIMDHTSNQYHKKEFCNRALELGLHVCWNASRGWAITSSCPNGKLKTRKPLIVNQKCLTSIFKKIRFKTKDLKEFQKDLKKEFVMRQNHSKQYQLKYICECDPPHNTIRSGRRPDGQRPLDATCNTCGAKFVLETL